MSTCNWLDLQALGSQRFYEFPNHCHKLLVRVYGVLVSSAQLRVGGELADIFGQGLVSWAAIFGHKELAGQGGSSWEKFL
jgi:hypothetical protein